MNEIKTAKDYFDVIKKRVAELDALGQAYLDKFEFLPSYEMADRIWDKAWEIFKQYDKDWDRCPELIVSIIENGVPFIDQGRDGSLFSTLALSLVSRDAHLRNLLEHVEGRETKPLDFAIMAE